MLGASLGKGSELRRDDSRGGFRDHEMDVDGLFECVRVFNDIPCG